uniref:Uncharacterized protein n=1 Tax=Romanomermis culicivorax TaxID=13658 RepID=A0A915LBW8_ROMCU
MAGAEIAGAETARRRICWSRNGGAKVRPRNVAVTKYLRVSRIDEYAWVEYFRFIMPRTVTIEDERSLSTFSTKITEFGEESIKTVLSILLCELKSKFDGIRAEFLRNKTELDYRRFISAYFENDQVQRSLSKLYFDCFRSLNITTRKEFEEIRMSYRKGSGELFRIDMI